VLTATGVVVNRPCRLYYARLVGAAAASAVLRDSVDATGAVVLGLATAAAGADDWPRIPVSLGLTKGLHATLTGAATLVFGWEPD
jgi:hypothetical protein